MDFASSYCSVALSYRHNFVLSARLEDSDSDDEPCVAIITSFEPKTHRFCNWTHRRVATDEEADYYASRDVTQ